MTIVTIVTIVTIMTIMTRRETYANGCLERCGGEGEIQRVD
jgi:hypothetical protein